jgi:hypothetical protein
VTKLSHYAKAIVAFVAPVLTDLAASLQTGPVNWRVFARHACVYMLGALVVWATPNAARQ